MVHVNGGGYFRGNGMVGNLGRRGGNGGMSGFGKGADTLYLLRYESRGFTTRLLKLRFELIQHL